MKTRPALLFPLIAACTSVVMAHGTGTFAPHDFWWSWSLEPGVIAFLSISGWLYWRGLLRIRQSHAPVHAWAAVAFLGGLIALIVALVSPLDAMGHVLFSAHMAQHEVLMLVAAPLIVLGRPLAPLLFALPDDVRRRLVEVAKVSWIQRSWRWIVTPLVAWLIHAAVLWGWHAPLLFQATLTSDWVHASQHLSFLISALLFYEAIAYGRQGRPGYGAGVVYVFTTAIHTSVLGALLTITPNLWYPAYSGTTTLWGLTPLEDQQLGGLIMWVPAGLIYVAGGLTLLGLWLRESERSSLVRENARRTPVTLP